MAAPAHGPAELLIGRQNGKAMPAQRDARLLTDGSGRGTALTKEGVTGGQTAISLPQLDALVEPFQTDLPDLPWNPPNVSCRRSQGRPGCW